MTNVNVVREKACRTAAEYLEASLAAQGEQDSEVNRHIQEVLVPHLRRVAARLSRVRKS